MCVGLDSLLPFVRTTPIEFTERINLKRADGDYAGFDLKYRSGEDGLAYVMRLRLFVNNSMKTG